jgi:hypothetical protein
MGVLQTPALPLGYVAMNTRIILCSLALKQDGFRISAIMGLIPLGKCILRPTPSLWTQSTAMVPPRNESLGVARQQGFGF